MDIHNTYTKWDLCKEDRGFDDEIYGYVSIYDLIQVGTPINEHGEDMEMVDNNLYIIGDDGEYHVIKTQE